MQQEFDGVSVDKVLIDDATTYWRNVSYQTGTLLGWGNETENLRKQNLNMYKEYLINK